jgi:hypothetical protein
MDGWISQAPPDKRGSSMNPTLRKLTAAWPMAIFLRLPALGNTVWQSGTLADANVYRFSSKEIHVNTGMY